jgi:hypothetical protein
MSNVFAVAPALPLHTAGKYVAGAYIVFLALVLVYVAIMASRLGRTERDLAELRRDVELRRQQGGGGAGRPDHPDHPDHPDRSDREREPVA